MAREDERASPSSEVKGPDDAMGAHTGRVLVHFQLFEQLKKRNVFRVAALYLVVCWLILEPPEGLKPTAEIPHGQSIPRMTGGGWIARSLLCSPWR